MVLFWAARLAYRGARVWLHSTHRGQPLHNEVSAAFIASAQAVDLAALQHSTLNWLLPFDVNARAAPASVLEKPDGVVMPSRLARCPGGGCHYRACNTTCSGSTFDDELAQIHCTLESYLAVPLGTNKTCVLLGLDDRIQWLQYGLAPRMICSYISLNEIVQLTSDWKHERYQREMLMRIASQVRSLLGTYSVDYVIIVPIVAVALHSMHHPHAIGVAVQVAKHLLRKKSNGILVRLFLQSTQDFVYLESSSAGIHRFTHVESRTSMWASSLSLYTNFEWSSLGIHTLQSSKCHSVSSWFSHWGLAGFSDSPWEVRRSIEAFHPWIATTPSSQIELLSDVSKPLLLQHSNVILTEPGSGSRLLRLMIAIITGKSVGSLYHRKLNGRPDQNTCGSLRDLGVKHDVADCDSTPIAWHFHSQKFGDIVDVTSLKSLIVLARDYKDLIAKQHNPEQHGILGNWIHILEMYQEFPLQKLLIFYEDLLDEPVKLLIRLAKFFGSGDITGAISRWSAMTTKFENLGDSGAPETQSKAFSFYVKAFSKHRRARQEVHVAGEHAAAVDVFETHLCNHALHIAHLLVKVHGRVRWGSGRLADRCTAISAGSP